MSQTQQGTQGLAGFVSVDEIVRSAIMDIGAGMERYETFKHWVLEGYRDFHFDMAQEIKTIKLSLTAWKAITLPDDFVDYVMIGIEVDKQIRLFTNDNRISLYLPDTTQPIDGNPDPRVGSNSLPDPTDITRFFFYNFDGRWMDRGKLFGLAVKSNGVGEFKMNKERREIQFNLSLDSATPIIMEYISNGITAGEKTIVNIYAAKLLKLYAHWQRLKFSKSANQAEIQRAENDYYREYRNVQSRLMPVRAEDVLEAHRDAYRLVQTI